MIVILCNIIAKRCHLIATFEQCLLGCEDLDVHVAIFTKVSCLQLKHNIVKKKNSLPLINSLRKTIELSFLQIHIIFPNGDPLEVH